MAIPSHLQLLGNKLENIKAVDTEPIDDIMKCDDPLLKNQVGSMLNDTEELYSPRSIEDCEAGYDTEVVPDSEDEMTDPVDCKRSLHGCERCIHRFAGYLDKVESAFHPRCEKVECLVVNSDGCDYGERVSGQTVNKVVIQGNDACPVTVCHGMQGTELHAKDEDISEMNNPCLVNAIPCDISCIDDSKQLCEKNKGDECGWLGQCERRDIRIVYTRKRKRTSNFEANDVGDEKGPSNTTDEYGGLSYVESQEPEDVSKALLFVDQYVGSDAEQSSPLAKFTTKDKSISAYSAKGACSLIRWANLRNNKEERGIFEWDDKLDGGKQSDSTCNRVELFMGKKYDQKYLRRSRNVRNMMSKENGNPGVLWKEKAEEPNDLTTTDATMVVYDCIDARVTEQICEKEAIKGSNMLDQQINEETAVMQLKAGVVYEESEYAFDVGINTQTAAEAIQALSFAVSWDCGEVDANKCRSETIDRSLEKSRKKIIARDRSFLRKARSASKGAVSQLEESRRVACSDKKSSEVQEPKLKSKRNRKKLGAGECMDGRSSDNSPRFNFTHKRKVYGAEDIKLGATKENRRSSGSTKQSPPLNVTCTRKGGVLYSVAGKMNLSNSEQKENHPKPLYENCMNTKNLKVSEESSSYEEEDDFNNNKSGGKIFQMGSSLSDKVNEGGVNMLRVSGRVQNLSKLHCTNFNGAKNARSGLPNTSDVHARPTNWYSRDYSRGKRTSKTMLGYSGGSHDFNYSSVKCHHLNRQLDLEGCFSLSLTDSNIMKKRRTSTYISPCWLLSQKKSEKILVKHNTSTTDGGKSESVPTLPANKNLISEESASRSNLIDDCHQHGKKKASTSLQRELVRLGFKESMPEFTSKDSRRRKTMADIQVLLSKSVDDRTLMQQKKILMRLGVSMASCPSNATHFIADKFCRTRNMLEFIAQGKPVVTPLWLESCQQAGFYIDETSYILRDMKREQELGFRLPISLDRAKKHPLLKGYNVIITPKTKPGQEMLTSLVKAVHGQVADMLTGHTVRKKMNLSDLIILSCEEDEAYCLPLLEKGVSAYSSELLLNGIIIQKLEFERHRLFTNHITGN